MKQNSSTEKSKNRGFTLVELIVVIAILAILSAVGAVAYTGYIEYTKKGLDKQTIGDVIRALELADYADPTLFDNGQSYVLVSTDGGIKVVSSNSGALTKALQDAFGSDLSTVKLTYSDWPYLIDGEAAGNIISNAKALLEDTNSSVSKYYDQDGTASYAEDMTEYWDLVEKFIEFKKSGLPEEQQNSTTYL